MVSIVKMSSKIQLSSCTKPLLCVYNNISVKKPLEELDINEGD
jgi:hypothetical protein